jgi:hypothetical protein
MELALLARNVHISVEMTGIILISRGISLLGNRNLAGSKSIKMQVGAQQAPLSILHPLNIT